MVSAPAAKVGARMPVSSPSPEKGTKERQCPDTSVPPLLFRGTSEPLGAEEDKKLPALL